MSAPGAGWTITQNRRVSGAPTTPAKSSLKRSSARTTRERGGAMGEHVCTDACDACPENERDYAVAMRNLDKYMTEVERLSTRLAEVEAERDLFRRQCEIADEVGRKLQRERDNALQERDDVILSDRWAVAQTRA